MSLMIKGMGMPDECSECLFSCYDISVGEPAQCIVLGERSARHCRPKICPLVEIPTPHGRLIDADKLVWFIDNHIASGKKWVEFETIKDMINALPTIIEAEVK